MTTYFALVHKDADSAYGISFPDLPGCFSAVDHEDEIFHGAQAALSLYASDEILLPKARSLSQLRADKGVAGEIAAGAFMISISLIEVSRKARYNLMLASDLVEGVDETATVLGISRSEFVAQAIGQRLKTEANAVLLQKSGKGRFIATSEKTGKGVSSAAAKVLKSKTASKAEKSVAASALTLTERVKKKGSNNQKVTKKA
ncbi:MAG: type II toxin-antitoxin system HicB family antitoxin [Hyphomicrobium sp.]